MLADALAHDDIEALRPLMPMSYAVTADAYRQAAQGLTADDLSGHYRDGLSWLHETFRPHLARRMSALSGGAWDLSSHRLWAGAGDTDFMTHLVEAVAAKEGVALYPGDWWGFVVGGTQDAGITWSTDATGKLACLCVPSVRNGQVTPAMIEFLDSADACLLNINLYPTLPASERQALAEALAPVLHKSIVSVSFSRGFGLTASQLGVVLAPPDHPYNRRFERQWGWSTYFHNALAAKAFMAIDLDRMQAVDAERRAWCHAWLTERGLPVVETGSYYVKTFRVQGAVPDRLQPLMRGDLMRLCLKPPQR